MKENSNYEELLHSEEYFVETDRMGNSVSVKRQVDFSEFPSAVNLDDQSEIRKVEIAVDWSDPDIIGRWPNGTPRYHSDVNETHPIVEKKMVRIRKIDKGRINKDYIAYVSKDSFELVQKEIGEEISPKELNQGFVVFRRESTIFIDAETPVNLMGGIIAYPITEGDERENPVLTGQYRYVANYSPDKKISQKRLTRYTINKNTHPYTMDIGAQFFANPNQSLETVVSKFNVNSIDSKNR